MTTKEYFPGSEKSPLKEKKVKIPWLFIITTQRK